jgi:NADH dehydrogenase (ubiquinone) 1 alpha subcomplex subunit 6
LFTLEKEQREKKGSDPNTIFSFRIDTMSAWAIKTATSASMKECRAKTLRLYRAWQVAAPTIIGMYQLDLPLPVVRAKIRQEFERYRHIQDPRVADILIHKGNLELQETMALWKQPSQLLYMLRREEADPKPTDFLSKFYEGRS